MYCVLFLYLFLFLFFLLINTKPDLNNIMLVRYITGTAQTMCILNQSSVPFHKKCMFWLRNNFWQNNGIIIFYKTLEAYNYFGWYTLTTWSWPYAVCTAQVIKDMLFTPCYCWISPWSRIFVLIILPQVFICCLFEWRELIIWSVIEVNNHCIAGC